MNKISNQKKQKKEPDNYFFGANPVINKVSKIEESSSNCAAYGSIAVKTIYFLLISAVGFVVIFFSQQEFSTPESRLTFLMTTMLQPFTLHRCLSEQEQLFFLSFCPL